MLLNVCGIEFSQSFDTIVEFPGVLLPAFRPTLQALQRMSQVSGDASFADLLAPIIQDSKEVMNVAAPQYTQKPGYFFDLSCLCSEDVELRLSLQEAFDMEKLQANTTLDEPQAESLKYALTHRMALIQGPPGTGKSYTGVAILQALTHNATKGELGPVICVTYTNHALDQLLERLVEANITQVIRVGSRSKSEVLEKLNLRQVVTQTKLTTLENRQRRVAKKELEECISRLEKLFAQFHQAPSMKSIREHLSLRYPQQYAQLFQEGEVDEEGFRIVGSQRKNPLEGWLSSGATVLSSCRPTLVLQKTQNLFSLGRSERRALYIAWVTDIRNEVRCQIETDFETYRSAKDTIHKVRQEQELRCLRKAQIIGMTTSGLARIIDQLKYVNAKVMLMEEAGEVLEVSPINPLRSKKMV